jgi:hypothetical protein
MARLSDALDVHLLVCTFLLSMSQMRARYYGGVCVCVCECVCVCVCSYAQKYATRSRAGIGVDRTWRAGHLATKTS